MSKSNKGKGQKTKSQRKGNKKNKPKKEREVKVTEILPVDLTGSTADIIYVTRPNTHEQTIFRNVPDHAEFLVKGSIPVKATKKGKGPQVKFHITNIRYKKLSSSKHGGVAVDEKGNRVTFNEYQNVQLILGSVMDSDDRSVTSSATESELEHLLNKS